MDPHRGNGNLFLLAATFLSLTSKKNFGLALLSLKSVLGKKLCLHYDQISKYPIRRYGDTPGFGLPAVSWKFVKKPSRTRFFLKYFHSHI